MTENALELRTVVKKFKGFTLGPIDLSIPEGSIYGLIGPNAAGKSTTIDCIMGMHDLYAGNINVFGMDHDTHEVQVKRRIGYVSPSLDLKALGRVDKIISFYRKFFPTWDDEYCKELIERLDLKLSDTPAKMSYGSKTKLNLLVALSHKPDLLLLDEPTAGLDPIAKHEVFTELMRVVEQPDRTILISSHNMVDVERFTDKIGILQKGKILLEDSTSGLMERFRMVSATAGNGFNVKAVQGAKVQDHQEDHWQLLIDTDHTPIDKLEHLGLTDIKVTSITLEELFVAFIKGT